MKKQMKIFAAIAVCSFLCGYMSGGGQAPQIPVGMEFVLCYACALLTGILLTKKFYRVQDRVRRAGILGFAIKRIELEKNSAPALALVRTEMTASECDLCKGEEVKLGDHRIPCPKCKAGSEKKKSRKKMGLA